MSTIHRTFSVPILAMSVRRHRFVNRPFPRRVPEVLGHTSADVISVFHEASWLAGPIGLLRARVAQRGLTAMFDVPRAGAIVKHHLTVFNDVRCLWPLPDGVCGLCLVHYKDDLKDHERCLWCHDSTICRACHVSIHISRDDGRVQACFDPSVWGAKTARLQKKYPFPASPQGDGCIVVQGCILCVREKSLMPESLALARWPMGFRRMIKEMVIDDDFKGSMAGYFYREFPRYYAERHAAPQGICGYPIGRAAVCEPCRVGTQDKDGTVIPNRVHMCTSLQVVTYRHILRAWAAVKRVSPLVRDWARFVYEISLVYTASPAHRTVPGILAPVAEDSDSDSSLMFWDEVVHVPDRNFWRYPLVKHRVVFAGNRVRPASPYCIRTGGAVLTPTRSHSNAAMDSWPCSEDFHDLPVRARPRFRPRPRRVRVAA